jgi:hypothetical protein
MSLTLVQLVPSFSQLHENYVLKSGEGLSIVFIIIWLAGDALNMLGAYIEGLLPTMVGDLSYLHRSSIAHAFL